MTGFSTDAILLKKIEYGDHDLILTFFSRSMGKISVIAKNAKQSVRRFSGSLDLFSNNHIQCVYPKKNKNALIILSSADLDTPFERIRTDILKTAYACYWLEMIQFWLEEGKQQEKLYELLFFSLEALNDGILKTKTVNLLFQIRFMSISGFAPNITACSGCGTLLDDIEDKTVWFDFVEGGIICANCRKRPVKYGLGISRGTLKQLFWINTSDMSRAARIKWSDLAIREGEILLESFIPFHIGREFKSLLFLKRIRKDK